MPTGITHALASSALAAIAPYRAPRGRLVVCLGLVAVLPDIDVVGFHLGIPYADLLGHRGFTHSLLFAFLASSFCALVAFRAVGLFSRAWWQVFALLFVAAASHGVLDAFTDAGLGIGFYIPFDDTRYFFPWRPLETSPLSVTAFLNGPALRILINEMLWIGLPIAGALAFLYSVRVIKRRRGT